MPATAVSSGEDRAASALARCSPAQLQMLTEAMGTNAPWLAFRGQHDGSGTWSTLIFVDSPTNPRYPNKWFVRSDPFPGVSFSFMFDEAIELAPREALALDYRLVVANRYLEQSEIEHVASE